MRQIFTLLLLWITIETQAQYNKCQDNRNEVRIGYNTIQYDTNTSSKIIIGYYNTYNNGDAGLDRERDYNTTYYRMSSSSKTMFICGTDTIYPESFSKDLSIKKNKSTVAGCDNLFIKIIIISICVAILVLCFIFLIWVDERLFYYIRNNKPMP